LLDIAPLRLDLLDLCLVLGALFRLRTFEFGFQLIDFGIPFIQFCVQFLNILVFFCS
jgi:hypothetical protein